MNSTNEMPICADCANSASAHPVDGPFVCFNFRPAPLVIAPKRIEWIAVVHGQNGTWKIACRNTAVLAEQMKAQTAAGHMIASVYERQAQD